MRELFSWKVERPTIIPSTQVNKHAEGLLVGGHPWVYENDILEAPETEPENGTLADVVSPKGAYLGTGFRLAQEQDPRAAHLPQRQRHLRRCLLAPPGGVCLELPQDRAGARRPVRLPRHLWRGRPVPRPDRGPVQQYPRHPDPERGHGKAQARPLPPSGRSPARRRPDHRRHLRAQR